MTIRRLHGLSARPGIALGAACMDGGWHAQHLRRAGAGAATDGRGSPGSKPPSDTATRPSATEKFLSLSEIEQRVTATGIRVTEIEVKDRIVEVEGRDASNRKSIWW